MISLLFLTFTVPVEGQTERGSSLDRFRVERACLSVPQVACFVCCPNWGEEEQTSRPLLLRRRVMGEQTHTAREREERNKWRK